ncbi:hypothetical protein IL306_010613 [Fusarium sp. DS 682]|nr:hypothetical protein IL306_010613 [Fusarium sp. DS 682]
MSSFFPDSPRDSISDDIHPEPTVSLLDLLQNLAEKYNQPPSLSELLLLNNQSSLANLSLDDIKMFLDITKSLLSLGSIILGQGGDVSRSVREINERLEREEQRRREAEEQTSEAQAAAEAAQTAAFVAQSENEATQEEMKHLRELWRLGIPPEREAADEEVVTARSSIGYVNGKTNIGVVGDQNVGKSTLVNCFRGIAHNTRDSAMTGEAETTMTSNAYRDDKHPNVVWHDVSGGGIPRTTAWQYYYDQKLFAYDKLILAHHSTLSEMNVRMLKVCKHREQECTVVRTKADEHIRNCKRRNSYETVEEARNDFINQVRRDTEAKNAEAGKVRQLAPAYKDYIVSEMGVMQLVCGRKQSSDPAEHVIDEQALLEKLELMH